MAVSAFAYIFEACDASLGVLALMFTGSIALELPPEALVHMICPYPSGSSPVWAMQCLSPASESVCEMSSISVVIKGANLENWAKLGICFDSAPPILALACILWENSYFCIPGILKARKNRSGLYDR